jgi:DNA-binding response OmpR family regulator
MGKKILLVDDEVDILTLYKRILEKEGYEIATAVNGPEALQKMITFKPNLVVLDIMMPEIDGWELSKKIRSEHNEKELPIIMLTVKSEIEDKVKSVEEAGANRHLTKPINGSILISTIKALLGEI